MATPFPILQRESLQKQAAAVATTFAATGKRTNTQETLQASIAEPYAAAAIEKDPPKLIGTFHDLTAVQSKGKIYLVEQKWRGNSVELRCFPPLPAKGFDKASLKNGDVADVFGKKFSEIDRIVLEGSGGKFAVHMQGKAQSSLDGTEWARGLAESALALVARAKNAADLLETATTTTTTTTTTKSRFERLTSGTPKPTLGPPLGHDLEGAGSWRGMPVAVTSDRDGKLPAHVMVETRAADGSSVWLPLAVPDDVRFPRRGCAVLLEGDTLQLIGGIDGNGKTTAARFTINLSDALKAGATAAMWKEKAPLKDAAAWAAAAATAQDAFVVGGVAAFYLKRGANGDDTLMPRVSRALQVGGSPQWRDRSAAPMVPAGSDALVDKGCVFVGPGGSCDGSFGVYDAQKSAWFSLPSLPLAIGLGQLHRSGNDLLYTGGFAADGSVNDKVYALNLNDPLAGWSEKGSSPALAGKARVVERDGKLVSLMVAPKGALMVHLE